MKNYPPTPYTVYYDGLCIVCDTEIQHYRRLVTDDRLRFVDIAAPDFHADDHGRSTDQFMAQMHLKDGLGEWHLGVDAFTLLWHSLPGRHWHVMARAIQSPILRPFARLGYRLFANNRHRLPRRKGGCDGGRCDLKMRP